MVSGSRMPVLAHVCLQSWRHIEHMRVLFRIGILRALLRSCRLSWRVLRDARTPVGLKLLLAGAVLLIVSPINWIPNFIPVLGQMEDIALFALALNTFLKLAPANVRAEHEAALGGADGRSRASSL